MDIWNMLRTRQPEAATKALLSIASTTIASIRRESFDRADTATELRQLSAALAGIADTIETAIPVDAEIAETIPT